MYADLKIIPATTVYYEDSCEGFIEYSDGTYPTASEGSKRETVESDCPVNTLFGDESVYGYSDSYSGYLMYSGNSAHKNRVDESQVANANGTWMPTASFSFTGDGFDLISATGGATSLVTVIITDSNTNQTVKKIASSNYFGYTYTEGENGKSATWTPSLPADNSSPVMYQIPVITWHGDYGNYTVEIIPSYSKTFDAGKLGYSDFYLDGVRIYAPIDVTAEENTVVREKYKADGELTSFEGTLRRMLISKSTLDEELITGVMFTDGNNLTRKVNTYKDYVYAGASNEITVPVGEGVSFVLDVSALGIPERILIGAKISAGVASGETATLVVACNGNKREITLAGATDMYYDITEAVEWENGMQSYPVTVYVKGQNGKQPLISLTKIKYTSSSEISNLSAVRLCVSHDSELAAYSVLSEEFGVNVIKGDINGDDLVTLTDQKLILKHVSGTVTLDGYDVDAADLDYGTVSSKDIKLFRKLLIVD